MQACQTCGTSVASQDRFCGNCGGAVQPVTRPADAAARELVAQAEASSLSDANGEARASANVEGKASAAVAGGGQQTGMTAGGATGDGMTGEPLQPTLISESDAEASEPNFYDSATLIEPRPQTRATGEGMTTPVASEAAATPAAESEEAHGSIVNEETGGDETGSDDEQPSDETGAAVEDVRATDSNVSADDVASVAPDAAVVPDELQRQTGGVPPRSTRTATGGSSSRHSASQLEPGTVLINRYEIVRRIGGGGMGAVYYAKDRNLGEQGRAVKEMIQSQLDESLHEKAIGDFKRESMLLASLEHPSIPTIYDYFYDDEAARFYLVMKYISGGDFLARIRSAPGGRIDELTVTDWAMQVADVLDYLHNRRPAIIYRDLKPANLMIDGNSGRVMLIDFGIARWVQKEDKGVTAVGTMGYAPPELFSGKVEPRSDIYSLGATMFHLMTGADPQDNPLLIFDFNKNPPPRQINPAISNEMERILMRAVEYNVESRFRSAADLRDALATHLERLRAGAVTYGAARGAPGHDPKTLAVDMVYCGFCGGRIAGDDVFCAHCGARQPLAAANASVRAARATAKLVVTGTTELDATFSLQKESNLVGRTDPQSNIFPDVDLSKFDPETKISRRHARIWRQGDNYLVEDLGSINGTVVNDSVKLGPRQPRTLESGDRLRLGETTLHFLIG